MKVPVTAMKIVCDVCGCVYEDIHGWTCIVGDEDGSEIEQEALDNGGHPWLKIGDKHYCPKCYNVDENEIAATVDGRLYDFEREEEIYDS